MLARPIFALFAIMLALGSAQASDATQAIRHVMKSTWDKPQLPVDVDPIVIVSDYAIARWTQDDMGGRALLRRKGEAWIVVLCAGDQLKQTEALPMAGIADDTARRPTAALADSEGKIAPSRVAKFSRFEGLVTVDEHSGHGAHKSHH